MNAFRRYNGVVVNRQGGMTTRIVLDNLRLTVGDLIGKIAWWVVDIASYLALG